MDIVVRYSLTGFFIVWLFLVAYLLWRHAISGSERMHEAFLALNDTANKALALAQLNGEATKKASDAALLAVESNHRLIVLLESHQTETT